MQSETPPKSALADLHETWAEAIKHQIDGRLESAEKLYRKILCTEARHACVWPLVGMIHARTWHGVNHPTYLATSLARPPAPRILR
jgi:hypothetical protein